MNEVAREVVLPAPPARVWEALSDPEKLSAWFGAEASIEVRSRGRARFRWPDGTERIAVVESAPSAGADDRSQPGASPGTTLLLERPQPAPPGPPIRARSP